MDSFDQERKAHKVDRPLRSYRKGLGDIRRLHDMRRLDDSHMEIKLLLHDMRRLHGSVA